ncbi:hypothetical protein ATCC90586_000048 [Pythium insidiosum]|nr:hypothetical protein ATCC90586_000048 [Pythium insidiosum]
MGNAVATIRNDTRWDVTVRTYNAADTVQWIPYDSYEVNAGVTARVYAAPATGLRAYVIATLDGHRITAMHWLDSGSTHRVGETPVTTGETPDFSAMCPTTQAFFAPTGCITSVEFFEEELKRREPVVIQEGETYEIRQFTQTLSLESVKVMESLGRTLTVEVIYEDPDKKTAATQYEGVLDCAYWPSSTKVRLTSVAKLSPSLQPVVKCKVELCGADTDFCDKPPLMGPVPSSVAMGCGANWTVSGWNGDQHQVITCMDPYLRLCTGETPVQTGESPNFSAFCPTSTTTYAVDQCNEILNTKRSTIVDVQGGKKLELGPESFSTVAGEKFPGCGSDQRVRVDSILAWDKGGRFLDVAVWYMDALYDATEREKLVWSGERVKVVGFPYNCVHSLQSSNMSFTGNDKLVHPLVTVECSNLNHARGGAPDPAECQVNYEIHATCVSKSPAPTPAPTPTNVRSEASKFLSAGFTLAACAATLVIGMRFMVSV